MINRSARRGGDNSGSIGGGGGSNNVVVITESSKTKERRSNSSSSQRSFMLPLSLMASFVTLIVMMVVLGRRPTFLLPSSSKDAIHASSLQKQPSSDSFSDNKTSSSLRKQQQQQLAVVVDKKYQLTPRHQFPTGWQNFSYDHIRHHFNCQQRSKDMNKPLPTLDDWNFMRRTYTQIVDKTQRWDDDADIDLVPPTLGYSIIPGIPIPPPYYAKLSPGKGRGLFASRNIQEGELVHDGTVSDVIFPNAMKFREYIFSFPRNFACDAAEWVWMQQLEKDGSYHLLMGINISSLMNSGGADWGDKQSKMVNVMPENEYSGKFYALRDIEMGEEILTDYDIYYTKWSLVGLGGGGGEGHRHI